KNEQKTITDRTVPEGKTGAGFGIDNLAEYASPLYAADKPGPHDTLASTGTLAQFGQHGFRYIEGNDEKQAVKRQDALLKDKPCIRDAQKNSGQTFEATALAIEGTQAGTYYGSVSWGWKTDEKEAFSKLPLAVVSRGVPGKNFLASAARWNDTKTSEGRD